MIPLRDTLPSSSFPVITVSLIAANIMVFIWQLSFDESELTHFFYQLGFIPALMSGAPLLDPAIDVINIGTGPSLLTSMFVHGSILHLVGNMLFLWIFGDNVEDRLGKVQFLLFYIAAGLAAAGTHYIFSPDSIVPTIGASGAIAGVMGAYVVMFPRGRVTTLLILGFYITVIEISVMFYLGFWFLLQIVSGLGELSFSQGGAGGVAWFAHVGGFIAGVAAALFFGGERGNSRRSFYDQR